MASHPSSPNQPPDHAAADSTHALRGAAAVAVLGLMAGGGAAAEKLINNDQPVPRVTPLTQAMPNFMPAKLDPNTPVVLPNLAKQTHAETDHAAVANPANMQVQGSESKRRPSSQNITQTPTLVIPDPEGDPPRQIAEDNAERKDVTPEMSKFFAENVVWLDGLGCSAVLVSDAKTKEFLGVKFAEHCGVRGIDGNRSYDQDGRPTIELPEPISVLRGDDFDTVEFIGEIKQLFLNAPDDTTRDMAYGLLSDKPDDLDRLLANSRMMSEAQIEELEPGSATVYTSGWPLEQVGEGAPKRQEFALTVLGVARGWIIVDKEGREEIVDQLVTAIPSKYKNRCSPGWSGSTGEVQTDSGLLSVGSATGSISFAESESQSREAGEAARRRIENMFGVSMKGMQGICTFSFQQPKVSEGAELARVISVLPEDPGWQPEVPDPSFDEPQLGPEQPLPGPLKPENPYDVITEWYTENFFSAEFKDRSFIDGVVKIGGVKGSTVINRPAVYYSPKNGLLFLAWHNKNAKSGLSIIALDANKEGTWPYLQIYDDSNETDPGIVQSTGAVGMSEEGFRDGTHTFGAYQVQPMAPEETETSQLRVVDNALVVESIGGTPEADKQRARDEFFDETKVKQVLIGKTVIGDFEYGDVVANPAIQYNPENGGAVLIYNRDGQVITKYYRRLSDIWVNTVDTISDDLPLRTFRKPTVGSNPTTETRGFFTTETGLEVGRTYRSPYALENWQGGYSYSVVYDQDTLKMKRVTVSEGKG